MARKATEKRVLIPRYIKGQIYRECGEMCCHCGKHLDFLEDFTLEHIIPLSKGGTNDRSNLVGLCEACNKAKSNDIIPPMEYFGYLPEAKKQALQAMFDKYITSQDWLDYDNLFITDWFDMKSYKMALLKKGALYPVPITLQVRHVRADRAGELIQQYKKHLSPADRELMFKKNDIVPDPYYEVFYHGKQLLFFTAYITEAPSDTGWTYMLLVDYYFNPDTKYREVTMVPTLFNILNSILEQAQRTLTHGSQGTAILARLRSPASAPLVEQLSRLCQQIRGYACNIFDIELDDLPEGAAIRVVEFVLFQGNQAMFQQILKENRVSNLDELMKKRSPADIQKKLKERLESSKQFYPIKDGHPSRKAVYRPLDNDNPGPGYKFKTMPPAK